MSHVPEFAATRARVEKTDRLARRMLAACLIFAITLIVVASVAPGFALQRLHNDVSTLKARQVSFHQATSANQKIIECQNKVFDQILADLPALAAGNEAPLTKKEKVVLTFIASAQSNLSLGNVFITLLVVLASGAAGLSIFLSRRTAAIRAMQTDTITALEGQITALTTDSARKDTKIVALEAQNATQATQIEQMHKDIAAATEMAVQAAKVDELRAEMKAGMETINTSILRLMPGGKSA